MKLNKKNLTYLPEVGKIEKKWWLVDADGAVVGRLATKICQILRGKDHPYYTPFFDCGDYIIVINARKVKLTGNKEDQKVYYRHSGYPGSIRETSFKRMLATHPENVILHAVKLMLPKNRLNRKILTKLKIFPDQAHNHAAQKPQLLKI